MTTHQLPAGIMKAINRRLILMGISLEDYLDFFEASTCREQDLKLLDKIINAIPDCGRFMHLNVNFPTLRGETNNSNDYRTPTECSVTSYDVTLPVTISVLTCPFFWNCGKNMREIPVELNNEELYSLSGFMGEAPEPVDFHSDFQLIRNIFRDFQPYVDSKLASRIPEKELKDFMGDEYEDVPLKKLLSVLSYIGFSLSRNSIVFPSIQYSVGITKNTQSRHKLRGIIEYQTGYTEDFEGNMGDVFEDCHLSPDMEDIYTRRDMEYFEGKDD